LKIIGRRVIHWQRHYDRFLQFLIQTDQ
jgi:hypothetical protein